MNRLTEKDARGNLTTRTYDARGNVLTQKDPDGRLTSRTYDAHFSQMLTQSATGLPDVVQAVNAIGRINYRFDGLRTMGYGYDARGQLDILEDASAPPFLYSPEPSPHLSQMNPNASRNTAWSRRS